MEHTDDKYQEQPAQNNLQRFGLHSPMWHRQSLGRFNNMLIKESDGGDFRFAPEGGERDVERKRRVKAERRAASKVAPLSCPLLHPLEEREKFASAFRNRGSRGQRAR